MTEEQMRTFIFLAEALDEAVEEEEDTISEEVIVEESQTVLILGDLADLSQRLRAFMESEGGDYALGVETGMQRAADMIENLIRRYNKGDSVE